jgi:hypothetical protein
MSGTLSVRRGISGVFVVDGRGFTRIDPSGRQADCIWIEQNAVGSLNLFLEEALLSDAVLENAVEASDLFLESEDPILECSDVSILLCDPSVSLGKAVLEVEHPLNDSEGIGSCHRECSSSFCR